MKQPSRSSLSPEIRALLHVPDDQTLEERYKRQTRERRWTGLWLGLALGLIYGAVTQSINHLYLPGLALYHPAPGPWLTALISMLLGGALGWVSACPDNSLLGILIGGLLGALAMDAATILETGLSAVNRDAVLAALAVIALPMVASLALVVAVFRWALDWRGRILREQGSWLLLSAIPVVMVLLIAWLGTASAYPPNGRTLILRTRDLIQAGRAAADPAALPTALRAKSVDDFLVHGQGFYTLEWDKDPTNRYAIPRPIGHSGEDALVIARFEDGWTLVCLYTWVSGPPQCISLD